MSMMDNRPSKNRIAAFLGNAKERNAEIEDGRRALRIYKDFRWQYEKVKKEITQEQLDNLINQSVARCEAELKLPAMKATAVSGFNKMREMLSRPSELMPYENPTDDDTQTPPEAEP